MRDQLDKRLAELRQLRLMQSLGLKDPRQGAPVTADIDPPQPSTGQRREPDAEPQAATEQGNAEIVLRKLIAQGQPWPDLKRYAWQIYRAWPGFDQAGRILELSFLHGDLQQFIAELEALWPTQRDAYFAVGSDLRPSIVIKLWAGGHEKLLNLCLFQNGFDSKLLRVERLYKFLAMVSSSRTSVCWDYFKRHELHIMAAAEDYGEKIRLSRSALLLVVGRLAYQQSQLDAAASYLGQIKSTAGQYGAAVDLLMSFAVEKDDDNLCVVGKQLVRLEAPAARLDYIEDLLARSRQAGELDYKDRNAINGILKELPRWIPEKPDAYYRLSTILTQAIDLDQHFPAIDAWFRSESVCYRSPVIARAIWEPLQAISSQKPHKNRYWQGVACLQAYAGQLYRNEELVWQAREHIRAALDQQNPATANYDSWSQLLAALVRSVARTARIHEDERSRVLSYLKIAAADTELDSQAVDDYLNSVAAPSRFLLTQLASLAQQQRLPLIEARLIAYQASHSMLTNQDLSRLWTLTKAAQSSDYAWRIASVLKHRRVLRGEVEKVWSVSGEHRQSRQVKLIPAEGLDLILGTIADDQLRRVMAALAAVGPRIPELLSVLNPKVAPVRLSSQQQFLKSCLASLEQTPWLSHGDKLYTYHPEGTPGIALPFLNKVEEGHWHAVAQAFAYRLGLISWQWDIAWLAGQLSGLVPRLHRSANRKLEGKMGRWLKQLSPAGRKSWYLLLEQADQVDPELFKQELIGFVMKLATSAYPNHYEALHCLVQGDCDMTHLRGMEGWICSDAYTQLRAATRTRSIIAIPSHLPASPLTPFPRSMMSMV